MKIEELNKMCVAFDAHHIKPLEANGYRAPLVCIDEMHDLVNVREKNSRLAELQLDMSKIFNNTDAQNALKAAQAAIAAMGNLVAKARLNNRLEPIQEDKVMNTMTFKFLANVSIEERWGVFETKTAFFDFDSPNFETSLPGFYSEEQKNELSAKLVERLLVENGLDRNALQYMRDNLNSYSGFKRSLEYLEVTLVVEGNSWEWINFSIDDPINHCNIGLDFLYDEEYADEMPEGWDY